MKYVSSSVMRFRALSPFFIYFQLNFITYPYSTFFYFNNMNNKIRKWFFSVNNVTDEFFRFYFTPVSLFVASIVWCGAPN